jgi:membrane protease YdiL (CAAX protease family)
MTATKPDKLGILLRVGLFILIGVLGMIIFPTALYVVMGDRGILVISALSTFAAAAVANAITVRIYERGRLSDLGLGWTATSKRDALIGVACGVGAAVFVLAAPALTGFAFFERTPAVEHPVASFVFVSIVLLFGAVGEEMLFRGYGFQLLVRSIGAFATILPVSIIFGMEHLRNPNATMLGAVNTTLWGVLLGFAYWRTNALWLPIGLHFGWNFTLPVFGANLSGFTMGVTGYTLHWRTGDFWSGGAYGPEGGILTTIVVIALFFVLHYAFPEIEETSLEA